MYPTKAADVVIHASFLFSKNNKITMKKIKQKIDPENQINPPISTFRIKLACPVF